MSLCSSADSGGIGPGISDSAASPYRAAAKELNSQGTIILSHDHIYRKYGDMATLIHPK